MRHALLAIALCAPLAAQTIAVKGETVYTMAGAAIRDGVVIVRDGRIERVGPAASTPIPAGMKTLSAKVVTPGLIDAAHGRNLKIHAWTVNDEARMRELAAAGIDGIITDRPDVLARILGRERL